MNNNRWNESIILFAIYKRLKIVLIF